MGFDPAFVNIYVDIMDSKQKKKIIDPGSFANLILSTPAEQVLA